MTEPAPTPPSNTPKLGIDLAEKHEDVRRLLAKFGMRACHTNGWDFEEFVHHSLTTARAELRRALAG